MKLKTTLMAAFLVGTSALAMSSANAFFFGGWAPWNWFDNGWYDYPYYGGYPGYYGGYPGYYGGYPGYYGGYPGYYGGYPGWGGYGYGYPAYGYVPQQPAATTTTTK